MKLNNKGVSLLELLISIVLVGIVLVFMFQLLVDLRNETENNDFAFNNQVNRTELIYTIQKDLEKYPLMDLRNFNYTSGPSIIFTFYKADASFEEIDSELILKKPVNGKYYIEYKSVDGNTYKWEMKDAKVDHCINYTGYMDDNKYHFKINIKLYTEHERNSETKNNTVDDIEISYVSKKFPNYDHLGYNYGLLGSLINIKGTIVEKKVGLCS